jgi:hypothetical protein
LSLWLRIFQFKTYLLRSLVTIRAPQFDDPTVLLEQPESFFAQLVGQAGDQRDVLRSMVFEAARKKKLVKQQ